MCQMCVSFEKFENKFESFEKFERFEKFESVPISRVCYRLNVNVWTDSCMSSGEEWKRIVLWGGQQGNQYDVIF